MPTQCHNCGSQLEEGAVVCAQCGQARGEPALSISFASASAPPPTLAGNEQQAAPPLFSAVSASAERGFTGIGGWLILPAIGLAINPFIALFSLAACCVLLFGTSQIAIARQPGITPVILFEAATSSLFLAAGIVLNILFYGKKKPFPKFMIMFFSAQFVVVLVDHIMAAPFNPHSSPMGVIRTFLVCAIWIPYFLLSDRVKLTFTR